jgi:uncharacterized iron-regulated membrane protein
MRRLLLTLHLWAGCILALLFVILGVTGSAMVFEEEIDRALNSKMSWVHPAGPRLPLTQIKAELERSHPAFEVQGFEVPPPRGPVVVRLPRIEGDGRSRTLVRPIYRPCSRNRRRAEQLYG